MTTGDQSGGNSGTALRRAGSAILGSGCGDDAVGGDGGGSSGAALGSGYSDEDLAVQPSGGVDPPS